jgi:hypothetical protein
MKENTSCPSSTNRTKIVQLPLVATIATIVIVAVIICSYGCTKNSLRAKIEAMPLPATKLYLDKHDTLTHEVVEETEVQYEWFQGKDKTLEWKYILQKKECLDTIFFYNLALASFGQTVFQLHLMVNHDKTETVLADFPLAANSKQFFTLKSGMPIKSMILNPGDQIRITLTAKGDAFALIYKTTEFGDLNSYVQFFRQDKILAPDINKERIKALLWIAENFDIADLKVDLFTYFKDKIYKVASNGLDARWAVDKSLMKSKKNYWIQWQKGTFSYKEMSTEDLKKYKLDKGNIIPIYGTPGAFD